MHRGLRVVKDSNISCLFQGTLPRAKHSSLQIFVISTMFFFTDHLHLRNQHLKPKSCKQGDVPFLLNQHAHFSLKKFVQWEMSADSDSARRERRICHEGLSFCRHEQCMQLKRFYKMVRQVNKVGGTWAPSPTRSSTSGILHEAFSCLNSVSKNPWHNQPPVKRHIWWKTERRHVARAIVTACNNNLLRFCVPHVLVLRTTPWRQSLCVLDY